MNLNGVLATIVLAFVLTGWLWYDNATNFGTRLHVQCWSGERLVFDRVVNVKGWGYVTDPVTHRTVTVPRYAVCVEKPEEE